MKDVLNEFKKIIVDGKEYFGTYTDLSGGIIKIRVVEATGDYLKQWFLDDNIQNIKQITLQGNNSIQIEELNDEDKIVFAEYNEKFKYAKQKALELTENQAFIDILDKKKQLN